MNADLRAISAFKDLPHDALARLVAACAPIACAAGEKLMAQGDVSEFALILTEGEISIVNERRQGAFPVATIRAPALLGEIGALSDLPRTASAIALSEITGFRAPRAALLEALQSAPEALNAVIRQLGQQIRNVNAALGLYADGFRALERGELDDDLAHDLGNVTLELQNFSDAFSGLARRITQERRTRADMASAALIQREMLPRIGEDEVFSDRCDVFGDMKPAKEVGGDFYDIFMLDEDRLALCVGDVCGKGVPASLFMCVTMTTLRLVAREGLPLAAMMRKANALLFAQNPASMFATLFFAVLDLRTRALSYVNCGHNPPFRLSSDGSCQALASGGPPLGIVPEKTWPVHQLLLEPGEGAFLFSDGVTEAMDPHNREYGEVRLGRALAAAHGLTARALVESVCENVARYAKDAEQSDDITCLAIMIR